MIDYSIPPFLTDFIQWINDQKLCEVPCKMAYMANFSGISTLDGNSGWAAYEWDRNQIVLAGDYSVGCEHDEETDTYKDVEISEEDQLLATLSTLAHEYAHHIQRHEGRDPDEEDAEHFAHDMTAKFLNHIRFNDSDQWTWEMLTSPTLYSDPERATL